MSIFNPRVKVPTHHYWSLTLLCVGHKETTLFCSTVILWWSGQWNLSAALQVTRNLSLQDTKMEWLVLRDCRCW